MFPHASRSLFRCSLKTIYRNKKSSGSSNIWLQRQKHDPFVREAKEKGFASRASFKILQILEGEKIMKPQGNLISIIDLGAAPGSWSQALAKHYISQDTPFKIVAVDKQNLSCSPQNVQFVLGDFTEEQTKATVTKKLAGKKADLVLSDMAPAACGDKQLDHDRLVNLSEEAYFFAQEHLKVGGTFVSKLSHGAHEAEFKKKLSNSFEKVKCLKPPASRKESNECFYIAKNKR